MATTSSPNAPGLPAWRTLLRRMDWRLLTAPVLVVLILMMLVVPLPTFVLDMLFTFNIVLSLIIMLVTRQRVPGDWRERSAWAAGVPVVRQHVDQAGRPFRHIWADSQLSKVLRPELRIWRRRFYRVFRSVGSSSSHRA